MKNKGEPLVRIIKKKELGVQKAMLLRLAAFIFAIIAGGIFIAAIGENPFAVYRDMVRGCFRSSISIQSTVKIAVPLLITSLGVTLAFKMKFWNIGAEGQFIMGAIFASYFALFHSDWPHAILIIVSLIAGAIGGGLWALITAFFKVKWGTNETLLTLMFNYIALYIIDYLEKGPWRDPEARGFPKIATFDKNAMIDEVFGVQGGWIIAVLLVVIIAVFLKYTKRGYEISVVGESQPTARYAGINVKAVVLSTMFLSGAVCGIGGMVQALGTTGTLSTGVASGVGFTAIIVSWLGQLNPFIITLVTAFFSILEKGSQVVQSTYGISTYAADVLQGIILFFILACEFFVRYSFVFRKKSKEVKE